VVVADAAAGIMKGLALFGDKLPSVFSRRERELQHAVSFPFANLAIRRGKAEKVVAASSSPNDNLPYSVCRVGFTLRVLRRESFVGMLVSGKNQVGVRGVQVFPQRLQLGMYGMALEYAAAKKSVMTIGQNASVGMFRKILLQPSLLRRASRAASQGLRVTIRIQRHNVPVAQVVAIVAFARWPRL